MIIPDESLPDLPTARTRSLGAILMDQGKIAPQDAERVLALQKHEGLRFGDAAIKLGLITEADIQRALSQQFNYSYLVAGDERVSPELVAAFSPFSKEVESLRLLRSQLMLRWFTGEPGQKAVAIVSPGRQEGRSYLVANLAVVFSQLGERTLVIDADLRNPRQHEIFRLSNQQGLSNLLAGHISADLVQRITPFANLSVLPAGPTPPNPLELLGRPIFQQLLNALSARYDVILVDSPSGVENGDAQIIAARTHASLMVVREDVTRTKDAVELRSRLAMANTEIVGILLTSF